MAEDVEARSDDAAREGRQVDCSVVLLDERASLDRVPDLERIAVIDGQLCVPDVPAGEHAARALDLAAGRAELVVAVIRQHRDPGVCRELHGPVEDLDLVIGEDHAEDLLVLAVEPLADRAGVAAPHVAEGDGELVALARVAHADREIDPGVLGEQVLGIWLAVDKALRLSPDTFRRHHLERDDLRLLERDALLTGEEAEGR